MLGSSSGFSRNVKPSWMDASEAARELETSRAVSDIDVSETDMSSDEEEEDDPISLASKVRVHFL